MLYPKPSKQKKGKFNHLTKQGVVSRCAICNSKMYWAKECQHKGSETVYIAKLNDKTEDNVKNIIKEANIVIMTTADTKIQTVLNNYRHCPYKNRCRKGMAKHLFKKS